MQKRFFLSVIIIGLLILFLVNIVASASKHNEISHQNTELKIENNQLKVKNYVLKTQITKDSIYGK
jgi:hypothetical protein